MEHERPHIRYTGEARRVPTGGSYQPDKLAFDVPDDLPPETPIEQTDGGKLAKRLIVAFVLIVGIAVINIAVLRRYNVDLAPMVLLGVFAVILMASIVPSIENAMQQQRSNEDEDDCADDGCAVGCCSGPRPMGEMTRKARQRMNQHRLPGHSPRS